MLCSKKYPATPTAGRRGFTLVELLVVIGIIALLISILLPSLSKARQMANRVKCLANLRSLGQAISIYAASSKGLLPIGIRFGVSAAGDDNNTSWALIVQGVLAGKKNASTYADFYNDTTLLNGTTRAYLTCPDAPTSTVLPAPDKMTNNVSYACHPLFFGGNIVGYAPAVPTTGTATGGYAAPMKPYNLASIKRSSEAILLADAVVIDYGDVGVTQLFDNPAFYNVDGGLMWSSTWTPANVFSGDNLDTTRHMEDSIDMTPVNPDATPSDNKNCNTDAESNGFGIRFRHMGNTYSNALMADGHADSFRLNPNLAPNDPLKTNLLRKYIYQ